MDSEPQTKRSFSLGRKWSIAFDVVLRTLVVVAVIVMVNYLSARHFSRFYLSSQTRVELSPRTVNLLGTITNDVTVTLYYDRKNPLFSAIQELINEYRAINPRITVNTVDYLVDASEAQRVKEQYKLQVASNRAEKNVIIFDCEGRTKILPGDGLAEYTVEKIISDEGETFRPKVVAFKGEMMFSAMLLGVTQPQPLKAYFLVGHGEHQIDSADQVSGYMKFAALLQQNYVAVEPIALTGTNTIPSDCNLLVIAGPTTPIDDAELSKVEKYLEQGGRLLALFNAFSKGRPVGLEKVLARWGIVVGGRVVMDPDNTITGSDMLVRQFGNHLIVNPIVGSSLYVILPRSVSAEKASSTAADAPKVHELAMSGPRSHLVDDPVRRIQQYPLIAAAEKGAVRGVVTERGTTRIVVTGDSLFLGNQSIDNAANRDFAGYAANWLLDRPQLMEGLGPKPVSEYRLNITQKQLQSVQWILLGGLPGGVMLLGALVWFGRRK
ncbi:MAG TPA: GldG family protein [Verrucomicrobiota bacterium]|nr:GldG family protein [Verrucomicrobiota bacterium]